jgi:hypothetical protein
LRDELTDYPAMIHVTDERRSVARRTIVVNDLSGNEIDEKNAAQVVIKYADARHSRRARTEESSEFVDRLCGQTVRGEWACFAPPSTISQPEPGETRSTPLALIKP